MPRASRAATFWAKATGQAQAPEGSGAPRRSGSRGSGLRTFGAPQSESDVAPVSRKFTPKTARPDVVLGFDAALRASRHRIAVTPRPRDWIPSRGLGWLPPSLAIDLRDWLGHLALVPFTIRHRRADLVLVAGFRTFLLAVVLIGLWPFREKLLFVVHHNLQFAHVRFFDRSFKLLCRLGVRFAFLEGEDGLGELGVGRDEDQFLVLPLPLPTAVVAAAAARPRPAAGKPVEIGVVGRDLPEKNAEDLLQHLLDLQTAGELPGRLLLASDNRALLDLWAAKGVETLETRAYTDYLAALARVDVVVLNYAREFYCFRSSSVINDAAGLGTPVVCPDYPVFRRQVSEPARIGVTVETLEEIGPAIHAALELARREPGNFGVWARQRSASEFSRRIDAFIDRQRSAR